MKAPQFALLVMPLLFSAVAVCAAPPIEPTIRIFEDQERVAALERNVKVLEELWSDDFTVNAPNNQVVIGRKAVLDMFVHSRIIDFSSFERTIEYIKADGDKVVVMGFEVVTPKHDAPAAGLRAGVPVKRRFTNIWKMERPDNKWRLYWRHANVIPGS